MTWLWYSVQGGSDVRHHVDDEAVVIDGTVVVVVVALGVVEVELSFCPKLGGKLAGGTLLQNRSTIDSAHLCNRILPGNRPTDSPPHSPNILTTPSHPPARPPPGFPLDPQFPSFVLVHRFQGHAVFEIFKLVGAYFRGAVAVYVPELRAEG